MSIREELMLEDQKFIERTEKEVLGFLESICPQDVDLDTMKNVIAKRWLGVDSGGCSRCRGMVVTRHHVHR